jgi:sugar phosphate isomerase/epimerase
MFSRRQFLQNTSLSLAGLALSSDTLDFLRPKVKHLGIQLYSLRDVIFKDPKGVIEAIAKMGYKEVEVYGYDNGKFWGLPTQELIQVLKSNGLKVPSGHCNLKLEDYVSATKTISDSKKKAIEAAAKLGQKYLVCPYMEANERDKIEQLLPLYEAAAKFSRSLGMQFAYHNHDFEFKLKGPDGKLLMEWLLDKLDPSLVKYEMDMYWVSFANHKILDWIDRYPGRWKLCHVKDMAKTERRETIEVGDGSIDFAEVFDKGAKKAGLEYYIIELEHYKTTPLEGAKRSRENFLKIKS